MNVIQFDEKEIQHRINKCQEKINAAGMQGMMLTNKYNIYYYSDYRAVGYEHSYTRSNFLFIPSKGKPILLVQVFNEPDARSCVKNTCEVRMYKGLMGPTLAELQNVMQEANMFSGTIGMEIGSEQRIDFGVELLDKMRSEWTHIKFTDASSILWSQRFIKSETEIQCIRKACQATSYAFDHIFDQIHVGMSEADVCRLMKIAMLEGGCDDLKGAIVCIGQENYPRISKAIGGNRKIQPDDFVWIDAQGDYRWYGSDFCRAGVAGPISSQREEMQNMIYELTSNVIKQLKPGIMASDVAQMCREEFDRAGHPTSFECGRFGHGVGLLSAESPSIAVNDHTVLQSGMVITLEPGIVNNYGVFTIEENILITKNGYEVLSGSSRKLHKII